LTIFRSPDRGKERDEKDCPDGFGREADMSHLRISGSHLRVVQGWRGHQQLRLGQVFIWFTFLSLWTEVIREKLVYCCQHFCTIKLLLKMLFKLSYSPLFKFLTSLNIDVLLLPIFDGTFLMKYPKETLERRR